MIDFQVFLADWDMEVGMIPNIPRIELQSEHSPLFPPKQKELVIVPSTSHIALYDFSHGLPLQ
jgi:hypothetical protein